MSTTIVKKLPDMLKPWKHRILASLGWIVTVRIASDTPMFSETTRKVWKALHREFFFGAPRGVDERETE